MQRRRIIFSYDKRQLIEYPPYFRISLCPKHFLHSECENAHQPFFLDFSTKEIEQKHGVLNYGYELKSKPKIDDFNKSPIPNFVSQNNYDNQLVHDITLLVNTLTNYHFFQYEPRSSWVMIEGDDGWISKYVHHGYLPPPKDRDYDLSEIEPSPNYGITEPALLLLHNEDGTFKKTVHLKELLDLFYESKDDEFKSVYLNACQIFNKGLKLEEYDMSASYFFFVSAIEALIQYEYKGVKYETCKECENTNYSVMDKFRKFIDKYGYKIDKKTINEFYNIRSNIAHRGVLLQLSYPFKTVIETQEDFDKRHNSNTQRMQYDQFKLLSRVCFRMFLIKNLSQ